MPRFILKDLGMIEAVRVKDVAKLTPGNRSDIPKWLATCFEEKTVFSEGGFVFVSRDGWLPIKFDQASTWWKPEPNDWIMCDPFNHPAILSEKDMNTRYKPEL